MHESSKAHTRDLSCPPPPKKLLLRIFSKKCDGIFEHSTIVSLSNRPLLSPYSRVVGLPNLGQVTPADKQALCHSTLSLSSFIWYTSWSIMEMKTWESLNLKAKTKTGHHHLLYYVQSVKTYIFWGENCDVRHVAVFSAQQTVSICQTNITQQSYSYC